MTNIGKEHASSSRRKFLRCLCGCLGTHLTLPRLYACVQGPNSKTPFSRFTNVAAAAGLTDTFIYGNPDKFTYIIESMAAGCAFFDYDNDGWMDILVLGGKRLVNTPPEASNRLYRNNRDGTFTDVTTQAGLHDTGWAQGVCVGDYNNDGWEDLFLTYYGQNRLYRNNGDGTFSDVTAQAGLLHPKTRYSSGCTFLDYNRDGLLDLFVSNYLEFDLEKAPKPSLGIVNCNFEGLATFCGPSGLPKGQQYLYRNNGDGTFTDVSVASGIASARDSYGLSALSFDADEDGWPDIFVACDGTPSLLFMNNKDGTFREEGLMRGVAVSGSGRELGGMGAAVGDYSLSGHLGLVKTHFLNQATGVYRNDGAGNFEDKTVDAELHRETRFVGFGVGFVDFDNDGYPDLLVGTGAVFPELEKVSPKYPAHSPLLLFRNRGDGRFSPVSEAESGMDQRHMSRGMAFGDFDNDGDVDILIMNVNEPPTLLRNDAPPGNRWIKLRLEGTRSNRSAIGAVIRVRYDGKIQVQQICSQSSFLSANDPRIHFGLGGARTADVEIRWPSGAIEKYSQLPADELTTIREGQGIVKGREFHLVSPGGKAPLSGLIK